MKRNRSLTFEQMKAIEAAIKENHQKTSDGLIIWKVGFSEATLAKELGVNITQVQNFRLKHFGRVASPKTVSGNFVSVDRWNALLDFLADLAFLDHPDTAAKIRSFMINDEGDSDEH